MKKYLFKNKTISLAFILLMLITAFTGMYFAFITSNIIEYAIAGDMDKLLKYLVFAILFVIVSVVLEFIYVIVKYKMIAEAKKTLKNDLFRAIIKRNVENFEQSNSGEYMNAITTQCDMFEDVYFSNYLEAPYVIFSFLFAVIASIHLQPIMVIVMIIVAIITTIVMKKVTGILESSTKKYAKASGQYIEFVKDSFSGFRLIQSFHIQTKIENRHEIVNNLVEEKKKKNKIDISFCNYIGLLIGLLSTVLIMGVASIFVIQGQIAVGAVFAFAQLIGKIISPINKASDIYAKFKSSLALKENFNKILEVDEKERNQIIDESVPKIELKNVNFSYTEKDEVLKGIDFTFKANGKYTIVGGSGSGKSTLLLLILGMYDIYTGNLFVHNHEVREINRENLSRLLGYVSQETFIFNDTLRNNITLYEDYKENEINKILKEAGLTEFIASLPYGLETEIKESGKNLSSGQKQRINLARVLLKGCNVLVLDEFTANLDAELSYMLENQLLDMPNKTIISISHKLEPKILKKYDQILVMKDGVISESGSYEQLIDKNSEFYSLLHVGNDM